MIRTRVPGATPRRARATSTSPSRSSARRRTNAVEALERRALLAAFVVTDAADSGPGTLRQAILDANTTTGPDTITFNLPGPAAVRTIRPLSALPEVTGTTTIDGSTRAGVIVELDGSVAGFGVNGLYVAGSNSVLRGLVINRFAGHGVVIAASTNPRGPTPSGVRVEANLIGADAFGNVDLGNGGAGVVVSGTNVTIGVPNTAAASAANRNVISGNGFAGVWVTTAPLGGPVQGPAILGNYIGTNAAGSRALGNGREGVLIEGATGVTVGGTTPAQRNVISGNASSGVRIGPATLGTVTVQNNYVGTNAAGSGALPNGWDAALPYHDGVTVTGGSGLVRIGGTQPTTAQSSVRNVISGNFGHGVAVEAGSDVQVQGNFIGTDATGNARLGNRGDGVAAVPLTEGPGVPALRVTGNLVSGNGGDGVRVAANARLMAFGGNYVGTNAAGTAALGNAGNGLTHVASTMLTQIGTPGQNAPGTTPPAVINPAGTARNVISANGGHGILLTSAGSRTAGAPRMVQNNYVGTDVTGTVPLGNGGGGVYIHNTSNATVGGIGTQLGNVISANGGNGVTIVSAGATPNILAATNNTITGNRIGTAPPDVRLPVPGDPGSDTGLGNRGHGVAIFNATGNRIGGPAGGVDAGNVIAYNDGNGVLVEGPPAGTGGPPGATTSTLILGNSIYGNGRLGIDLSPGMEGVTPNDPRDVDTGPNGLLNFPTITEAVANATGTAVQVRWVFMGEPGRTIRLEFFSSPLPDASGYGEGRNFLGIAAATTDASGTASGTFNATTLRPGALYFTATATQNSQVTSEFSPAVRVSPPPTDPPVRQGDASVVGRHVFYNNSAFDGFLVDGPADDAAVAPDKEALLPGQAASFENVTSYDRGLTGVMVDVAKLPAGAEAGLTRDDFVVVGGPGNGESQWGPGPQPFRVTVRRGAGVDGSDRVTLYWVDYNPAADSPWMAVLNGWVRVTMLANADTGLAAPDVFLFGNLVGETGDAPETPLRVSALDVAGTKGALGRAAGPDSRFDHNRDAVVNALDLELVKRNLGRTLAAPVPPGPMIAAPEESASGDGSSITEDVLG